MVVMMLYLKARFGVHVFSNSAVNRNSEIKVTWIKEDCTGLPLARSKNVFEIMETTQSRTRAVLVALNCIRFNSSSSRGNTGAINTHGNKLPGTTPPKFNIVSFLSLQKMVLAQDFWYGGFLVVRLFFQGIGYGAVFSWWSGCSFKG